MARRSPNDGVRPPMPDPESTHVLAALNHADDLVQHLAAAKYALTMGDTQRAMDALDEALVGSRRTLTELLAMRIPTQALTFAGTLVRAQDQLIEPTASAVEGS